MLQQWQLDILEHADPAEERRALEDHADARAELSQRLVVGLRGVEGMAVDRDRPGLGTLESDEMTHEHRLAGSNRAENEHRLTASDAQVDVENNWRTRRTREVLDRERPLRGRERG